MNNKLAWATQIRRILLAIQELWMKPKLFIAFFGATTLWCTAQTPFLYDNFNDKLLSASRWSPVPACYAGGGLELECVREIQNGKLHLAHRNFGQRNSDTGLQLGGAAVGFANPASIKSITTDLVVRQVAESPCAANLRFEADSANIWGVFFNAGAGDPSDDVGAQIVFGRRSFDPLGQLSVFAQTFQGGNYGPYLLLGSVPIGIPVTATVTWDQANHQFAVSWTNNVTHQNTGGTMPYGFADTAPAANPGKVLEVSGFPANCTASPTSVYVDALFDNVYIRRSR